MVGTVSRLSPDSFEVDSMDLGFVFRSGIFGMLVELGLEALSKSGVVIGGAEAGGMVSSIDICISSNEDSGVFVSKDGGKTWDEAKIDGSQYSAIAIGSQNEKSRN